MDHPRSRGVYTSKGSPALSASGSSPLARGLHIVREAIRDWARIIPARAGFTGEGGHVECHVKDHPRSRGVYVMLVVCDSWEDGSSPLARGLRYMSTVHSRHKRIIPARAGFTASRALLTIWGWDHPRSRGVYS